MHENKKYIFLMFRRKLGILIWDLYLYSIKIQTIIKQNSIKLYAEKSQTFKNTFNFFYWAGPGPLILSWPRLVRPSEQWSVYVNSGDSAVKKKKEKGKGRKADLLTLTVMLVAVERKPTMVHGGYDGGGQCLLQLFFFFPVQRTSLCCCFSSASVWFFSFWSLVGVELLVAFRRCGGGCWPVELLWGAMVALLLSRLCSFFFCCWSILPSQWRRCGSGGLENQRWFSFFLPSSSVTFFPHGSFLLFFFVFSFPFCLLSLSSPPLCFYFPPSLSRSLFCVSLFRCAVLVRLWWRMAVAAGRRRWADDGVGSAGAALSPPLFFPLSFLSGFPSRFLFFFFSFQFSSVLLRSSLFFPLTFPSLSVFFFSFLCPSFLLPLVSVSPLAFIARGCMRYCMNIVMAGVH